MRNVCVCVHMHLCAQPGLNSLLDLRYFACKNVSISTKLVFGYRVTGYSNPVAVCVNTAGKGNTH